MAKWMAGSPTGHPDVGLARTLARRLHRRRQGPLRGRRDRPVGAAAPGRSSPAGHRRPGGAPVVRRVDHCRRPQDLRRACGGWPPVIRRRGSGRGRSGDDRPTRPRRHARTADSRPRRPVSDVPLVAEMEVMARLVNANLGLRVLSAGWGDFDSHAGQPNQHSTRMRELNAAVARFFQVLAPAWASRVTIMTFSEFGRTSWSNDGAGTDHGTSAPHFVLGANVRGGRYGQRPSLAGLRRWDRMPFHVDFRDYYGSVIDGWLGGGASDVLGARAVQNLALFARAPGVDGPPPPAPAPAPGPHPRRRRRPAPGRVARRQPAASWRWHPSGSATRVVAWVGDSGRSGRGRRWRCRSPVSVACRRAA